MVIAGWQGAVASLEGGVARGAAVLGVPLDGPVPLLNGTHPAGFRAGPPLTPRGQHAVHRAGRVLLAPPPLDQFLGTGLSSVLRVELDHASAFPAPVAARLGARPPLGPGREHAVDDGGRGLVARGRQPVVRRQARQSAQGR